MAETTDLQPDTDLAGSWELDQPATFSGGSYTEPTLLGARGAGYTAGDGLANPGAVSGPQLPSIPDPNEHVWVFVISAITDDQTIGTVDPPTLKAQNELQRLVGTATESFTLTFGGSGTTASIPAAATATQVHDALEAILGGTAITATGGPLGSAPVDIEFNGAGYAQINHPQLISSSPTVVVSTIVAGAADVAMGFLANINDPQAGPSYKPQANVWGSYVTSGFSEGRAVEIDFSDQATIKAWTAYTIVVGGLHSSIPIDTAGTDNDGLGKVASWNAVTPTDPGSKLLAVVLKAVNSAVDNYPDHPNSYPSVQGVAGYQNIGLAVSGPMTLASFLSPALSGGVAETPPDGSWVNHSDELWSTWAMALNPAGPATAGGALSAVLGDSSQTSWAELGNALGSIYEVMELDLATISAAGGFITQAQIQVQHTANATNSIEVALVGISADGSTITPSAWYTARITAANTVLIDVSNVITNLNDGTGLHEWDRLGLAFRSTGSTPGTTSHRLFSASVIAEYEVGGPVVSNVAGPASDGDPITWTYSADAGIPQTAYQVLVIAGSGQDPTTATAATDPLNAGTGEIIHDSGVVYSTDARSYSVDKYLGRDGMTVAVRAWSVFSSGLEVVSDWATGSFDLPGSAPSGPSLTSDYFTEFPTVGAASAVLGAEWEIYDDPNGNAGFGERRPAQAEVVAEASSTSGGNVLRITAENVGGDHHSAGLKLLRPHTYMEVEARVRVAPDATIAGDGPRVGLPGVNSGVVLFWPVNDLARFPAIDNPEGPWPAGGEIDFWETYDDPDDREPVKSYIHRLNPAATTPYVSTDDQFIEAYEHTGVAQDDWHKLVMGWTADEIYMEVDNGPRITLTDDPAWIPDWAMEPTFQLDPWSNTPPASPVEMDVDYVVVRTFADIPAFDPLTGSVETSFVTPAGISRAWLQRSVDNGVTWTETDNSPITVSPSTTVTIEDPTPPINELVRYRVSFDSGPMSETSVPTALAPSATSTATEEWYLQAPADPSLNLQIEVREFREVQHQRSVEVAGTGGAIVSRSKPLGSTVELEIYEPDRATREALDAILDSGHPLRLVNILGREWTVQQVEDRTAQMWRVLPLPSESTQLRDFHTRSVVFREVVEA